GLPLGLGALLGSRLRVGGLALPAAAAAPAVPEVAALADRVQRAVGELAAGEVLKPVSGVDVVLVELTHDLAVVGGGTGPVTLLLPGQSPQQAALAARATSAQGGHHVGDDAPFPVRHPLHRGG